MNPLQPAPVLAAYLRDCAPRLLVVAHGPPNAVVRAAAATEVTLCEITEATQGPSEVDPVPLRGDASATIAYRPADPEEPTGVLLTQHNLAWSAAAAATVLRLTGSDTLATHFPLHHPLGQTYGLNAAVAAAATLLLPTIEADSASTLIESDRPTVLSTFPLLLSSMTGADSPTAAQATGSLRTVYSAGGRNLEVRCRERLSTQFGCEVLEGYGTVEMSSLGCATRSGESAPPGSMGRPVDGVEMSVVNNRGREAVARRAGVLIAKGPNVTSGYWRRPGDSERAFSNGWLLTGEKARQDADGNIYLLDNVLWTDPLRGSQTGREGLLRRGARLLLRQKR
jgi:long-chain acyl-CoA synthetase